LLAAWEGVLLVKLSASTRDAPARKTAMATETDVKATTEDGASLRSIDILSQFPANETG